MTLKPGFTQIDVNPFMGGGAFTLDQLRDPVDLGDGIPPEATFGYIQFVDYDAKPRKVESAGLWLDDTRLHLIDFLPVDPSEGSVWRIRLWGGLSGHAYRARVQVADTPARRVAIRMTSALETRPMLNVYLIGMVGAVPYQVTGVVDGRVVQVTGAVGV